MMAAGFGAVLSGIQALDAHLDERTMRQIDAEDLAACWRTTSDICKAADALYAKLRGALADEISRASKGQA